MRPLPCPALFARPHRSLPAMARPLGVAALMWVSAASHAQLVPKPGHAFRQAATGELTETRLQWQTPRAAMLTGSRADDANDIDARRLSSPWEGRAGAMIDHRPADPMREQLAAGPSTPPGLRLRSLHVLTDYYVAGGLRATAGVIGGDAAQAWWGTGERGGGLNLSLQRVEGLLPGLDQGRATTRTMAYVGAGYSTRLTVPGSPTAWQFSADFGLAPRLAGGFGDAESLPASLTNAPDPAARLRHVVKVSVGYAF